MLFKEIILMFLILKLNVYIFKVKFVWKIYFYFIRSCDNLFLLILLDSVEGKVK